MNKKSSSYRTCGTSRRRRTIFGLSARSTDASLCQFSASMLISSTTYSSGSPRGWLLTDPGRWIQLAQERVHSRRHSDPLASPIAIVSGLGDRVYRRRLSVSIRWGMKLAGVWAMRYSDWSRGFHCSRRRFQKRSPQNLYRQDLARGGRSLKTRNIIKLKSCFIWEELGVTNDNAFWFV